jgi:4a-hydroxytetrahydrobiopterin dehydratase
MTTDLATKHCVPCERGTEPMSRAEAESLATQVPDWSLVDGEALKLSRELKFKNFAQAMSFINSIAEVAEAEGHHPDMCVSWNRVKLDLLTHSIGGLSENDFIMAAKINELKGAATGE